ncbi:MAG: sulfatase-like hydrolase/transferase [Armatimonadota bacterium]
MLRDIRTSGLITSLTFLMFFSYGHFYTVLPIERWMAGGKTGPVAFFVVWAIIYLVGVVGLMKHRKQLDLLTTAVNVAFILLVGNQVLQMAYIETMRAYQKHYQLQTVTSHGRQAAVTAQLPNIYYIVMDSYGRSDTLKAGFQYDNSPFLGHLRSLGFYVADQSRPNYCQTSLSVSSQLNMDYLDAVAQKLGKKSKDRWTLTRMIADSRVVQLLRRHGYKVVVFPSGYTGTQMPSDVNVDDLNGLMDFHIFILNTTTLLCYAQLNDTGIFDPYAAHRRRILYTLKMLPETVHFQGPCFIFAHMLAPHPPLVFDEHGNPVAAKAETSVIKNGGPSGKGDIVDYRKKYRGELIFMTKQMQQIMDEIVHNSTRPVIIILQSDHGPGLLTGNESVHEVNIWERSSNLTAVYLPFGGAQVFYPSVTPVNIFRLVFNQHFGSKYTVLPDRTYYSPWDFPFDFTDVTVDHYKQPEYDK